MYNKYLLRFGQGQLFFKKKQSKCLFTYLSLRNSGVIIIFDVCVWKNELIRELLFI